MLEFCRRRHGRVLMFLLVFLLLISIPMAGGSANRERIRRIATAVLHQIDGSDSVFCTSRPMEPKAAEVRPANPSAPLLAAHKPENELAAPENRNAGGYIPAVVILCIAAAAAACIIPRGRSCSYRTLPRRSRASERYRRLFSGNYPPVLS